MIGIIGALDAEITEILKKVSNIETMTIHQHTFYKGVMAGKECVVVKTGIGKVNAACATTLLLNHFEVEGVINVGSAGGMKENQKVFDVIISEKVANYDFNIPGHEKSFENSELSFETDKQYIQLLKDALKEDYHVHIGNMVSGDSFIYEKSQIDSIFKFFPSAIAVEMEAVGIAQVCRIMEVPFIIIRSISDIVTHPNNEFSFDVYLQEASKRSAIYCEKMMACLNKIDKKNQAI